MSNLLARYAECVFWMGRQIERADNLARILDVHESFSADSQGELNWRSLLQLYSNEADFSARYAEAEQDAVLRFYILDRENPNSVLSSLRAARENARTLRSLISTEMWVQVNTFYGRVSALKEKELTEENVSRLCAMIKESCQAQMGVAAETFYRDEGWYFYQLGMNLERADQTTRLLDVKSHQILPQTEGVGSPLDISQWTALLRSAAGLQAYRRVKPGGVNPVGVAEFLLLNERFPRSVAFCVGEAAETIAKLRRDFGLERGKPAERHLLKLIERVRKSAIKAAINDGLHDHLDKIQRELIASTELLGSEFFALDVAA